MPFVLLILLILDFALYGATRLSLIGGAVAGRHFLVRLHPFGSSAPAAYLLLLFPITEDDIFTRYHHPNELEPSCWEG